MKRKSVHRSTCKETARCSCRNYLDYSNKSKRHEARINLHTLSFRLIPIMAAVTTFYAFGIFRHFDSVVSDQPPHWLIRYYTFEYSKLCNNLLFHLRKLVLFVIIFYYTFRCTENPECVKSRGDGHIHVVATESFKICVFKREICFLWEKCRHVESSTYQCSTYRGSTVSCLNWFIFSYVIIRSCA